MAETPIEISIVERLADVSRTDWDALANPPGQPHDPFVSWDFLEALEHSGSATPATGWAGRHLLARRAGSETVLAATPLWLRAHSRGEYIFDHAFADAWHRAGGRWYPKLTAAVPFVPVTGRRLLAAGPDAGALRGALLEGMRALADRNGLAAAQVNFPDEADREALEAAGWLMREDRQFHFLNPGYGSFDDFLGELSSERRKNLRKERARAGEDLEIVRLSGDEIGEEHWDAFFECYLDTGERKWGSPYLTRAFFRLIHERMRDRVLLVMARAGGRWIAAALNFLGSDAIFGRHWGRLEDRPFLHFELCYYQAIDEAIARGLKRVEAGAQGGHKVARGYVPVATWQGAWYRDPGLRGAIGDYLARERAAMAQDDFWLKERAPFRRRDHTAD